MLTSLQHISLSSHGDFFFQNPKSSVIYTSNVLFVIFYLFCLIHFSIVLCHIIIYHTTFHLIISYYIMSCHYIQDRRFIHFIYLFIHLFTYLLINLFICLFNFFNFIFYPGKTVTIEPLIASLGVIFRALGSTGCTVLVMNQRPISVGKVW